MSGETSLSVVTARPVVAALEARGLDAGPVLRAAGLSHDALSSIDHRLPHRSVSALWEAAADAAREPAFGVHVAEALPRGAYDLLDYALASAPTLGAALSRLTEYIPLIHDRSSMHVVVDGRRARIVRRVPVPAPQYDEFSMTLLLVRSRQACGSRWIPERMVFQHERTRDGGELARVFGCPVAFGGRETEVWIDRGVLALPHAHADSALLAVLSRHADALLESMPPRGSLVARAASAVARRMRMELPTLAKTAAALRLPERTLQRRLAEEGVSHSLLVDDVRRTLALKYLAEANVSITEIAYLLHFADASVFSRAFRRWTGESPLSYRKRLYP